VSLFVDDVDHDGVVGVMTVRNCMHACIRFWFSAFCPLVAIIVNVSFIALQHLLASITQNERTKPTIYTCTISGTKWQYYYVSSWDVAAGSILIEESGGCITNLENVRWDLRTRKICATVGGGPMHVELLQTLAEAGVVWGK
jgi:hypothetical protein